MKKEIQNICWCGHCQHYALYQHVKNVQTYERFKTKDGKLLFVTSFICPKCDKQVYVQIDTKKTMRLIKQMKALYRSHFKGYINGEGISKESVHEYEQTKETLKRLRGKQNDDFNGCFLTNVETKVVHLIEISNKSEM